MSSHDHTRNSNNLSRKRLILDYVDPYGGLFNPTSSFVQRPWSATLKAGKQTGGSPSGQHPARDTVQEALILHANNSNQEIESLEGMSPCRVPSLLSFGEPVGSTPKHHLRSHQNSKSSLVKQSLPSPLPPSSPPSPLSQFEDHLDLEDEGKENEVDPFGFLATERILKTRKRTVARAKPGIKAVDRSSVEGTYIDAVATGQGRHNGSRSFFLSGQKRLPTSSPAASPDPKSRPLSLCQPATRRKLETPIDSHGEQRTRNRKSARTDDGDPEYTVTELESLISKGSQKRVRKRPEGKVKERTRNPTKKRTTRKRDKTREILTSAPDHLDADYREDSELEIQKREERIRYYQRLDSYHLLEEKVWVV